MRPTPNLPNSTILNPILSKIQNTNVISTSLYSYANLLLNLVKSNEKTSDLEVKLSESNLKNNQIQTNKEVSLFILLSFLEIFEIK